MPMGWPRYTGRLEPWVASRLSGAVQRTSEGDEHHAEEKHTDSHNSAAVHDPSKHNSEGDEHGSDHDSMHNLGGAIGIFGGFLLLIGHIVNLRTSRTFRKECSDKPPKNEPSTS